MKVETSLQALIEKYRYHMDFAELDLSDINQQCYPGDDAIIHLVARVGGPDEVELLIVSGARVSAVGDMGFTALHYAATNGRLAMAKRLLDLGADPAIRNEWGQTAAILAMMGNHTDIVRLLKRSK